MIKSYYNWWWYDLCSIAGRLNIELTVRSPKKNYISQSLYNNGNRLTHGIAAIFLSAGSINDNYRAHFKTIQYYHNSFFHFK